MARVRIQEQLFDVSAEIEALCASDSRVGAVTTFVGTVRDHNDGQSVCGLELEHYPGMTEKCIDALIETALETFDIFAARIIHRIGKLSLQDPIVLVVVSSAHRRESFQACEYLMDHLKTQAPFWKKEAIDAGERWVDARSEDDQALERWHAVRSKTGLGPQVSLTT